MNLKSLFSAILATSLMGLSLSSQANGEYAPGTVLVTNGGLNLQGAYNVRFNPNVTKGYINIGGSQGQSIGIMAVDSTTGTFYYCYATPTDAVYASMEKILYAAGNGSTLSATRNAISKCQTVGIQQSSTALH